MSALLARLQDQSYFSLSPQDCLDLILTRRSVRHRIFLNPKQKAKSPTKTKSKAKPIDLNLSKEEALALIAVIKEAMK